MTDEAPTTEAPEVETPDEAPEEQKVPYERFQQANKKAKEAADRTKAIEKQLVELQAQVQEREEAGLPELERERKRAEALEKKIAEAESRAEKAEKERENTRRERWLAAAAAELNFVDPEDAVRYVSLDDIDDQDAATRAVKAVAKKRAHLIKAEERQLPGQVLRASKGGEEKPKSNIDPTAEAEMLAEGLKQFASQ
jgi:colicin import membrane protein